MRYLPPVIERASAEHAQGVAALYAPYVTETAISFELIAPDATEIAKRIDGGLPWFVAMRDDEVVGFCTASQHRTRPAYRWSVDCSVYLSPEERGRGTARALYQQLFDELRLLGYVQAFAGIALPNPASVSLHEALGFELVGVYREVGFKLGRWHDVGWWQLTLRPPPDDPAEPAPGLALPS